MLCLKRLPSWRWKRSPISIDNCFQALLAFVAIGVVYRYCWIDTPDPFKCGALLNQGEWLDPDQGLNEDDTKPFQNWQVPGCLIHKYTKRDIEECFQQKRLVLIGDSTTRQIFWAIARKFDQGRADVDTTRHLESTDKHQDLDFKTKGADIKFIWDPYLNSTSLEDELKKFHPQSLDGKGESAAVILLGAPGLWYARYIEENAFTNFRDAIQRVIPYMDHTLDDSAVLGTHEPFSVRRSSPNLLLLAPVQVPHYENLTPAREKTITPAKIDQMNDYLQQASAYSRADVLWSYSLMTFSDTSEYEESGLHVIDSVAANKADVLLNLRCNADAARSYPYDRTCCSNYKRPGGAQWLILFAGMLVLPLLLFVRRTHCPQVGRYLPSTDILSVLTAFCLVVCYCFYTDRSQLFEKAQKQFHQNEFIIPCIILGMAGLLSIRRSQPTSSINASEAYNHGPLSRDQTDEWKGWMQGFILIYHYTHGSQSLEIYEIVRTLVASYLFMTGYGHTCSFLRTEDYSLRRVAAVLVRLNLLTGALTYMMRTDYLFYYFPALVSFWFLVVFAVLSLGKCHNSNTYYLVGKILLAALLTSAFIRTPKTLEWMALLLKYTCGVSWNVSEWRFRLFLDMYIVYVGMVFAVLHHRVSQLQPSMRPASRYIDGIIQLVMAYSHVLRAVTTISVVAILSGFLTLIRRSPNKEDYNWWQPYISFVPILCFICLRNLHQSWRNYHSALFAWLGRISLETYVLQYHIWLAGDTKGLLRLGLFSRGWEAAILTTIFIWLSWCTANATRKLTSWIVDGSTAASRPLLAVPALSPQTPTSDGGLPTKEAENESGLNGPVGIPTKIMMILRQDLKWRLWAIALLIWIGNVTYW